MDTQKRMEKELENKTQEHGKQIAAFQQANMESAQKSKQNEDRLQAEKSELQVMVTNFRGKKTLGDKVKVLEDVNIALTEEQEKLKTQVTTLQRQLDKERGNYF